MSGAFAGCGVRVSFMPLLSVRASSEAIAQTLPMGVIWAESIKPMLLGRRCGVPVTTSIAAMAARKYLLMFSQAIYIAVLALLGSSALHAISRRVVGVPGLEWIVLSSAGIVAAGALGMRLACAEGLLAGRVLSLLQILPIARLRAVLVAKARGFCQTDRELSHYFRLGIWRSHAPAIWFLLGWLCEALETYLILRLLGVELDFTTVAACEVALSFVRSVVFVLPSGLGVQDLGYVACLKALGVEDALTVGAAFVMLKRAKEAFWAAIGFGLLFGDAPRPACRNVPTLVNGR
jgi:hypothetical protein